MKFSVDPKIFELFPGIAIGVMMISDMVMDRSVSEITTLLRQEEARQMAALQGTEMNTLPEIMVWREIYRKFGSNPGDFRSSIESLLRRARSGKPLPEINPLVDLYNYLSLKYHFPAGAEDLDKIEGDITLTFADGTEKGIALGFETQELPDPGEVIYKDDAGFICRKWNWREADRTKIDSTTRRAILVLEKAPGIPPDVHEHAMTEAKSLLESQLGATCAIIVLNEKNPATDISGYDRKS